MSPPAGDRTVDHAEVKRPHLAPRPEFANFDYLRLLAALAVLSGHAIVVAQGNDHHDPLVRLFGQDMPTGTYAVCVFFIISGFLVTMSARTNRSLLAFAGGRVLRIYPGLFTCQLLTALVLGGLFTHLAFATYVSRGYPIGYALQYTLDPGMTWNVPTVAFYHDGALNGVSFNASLWSIQQELFCYVLVAILLGLRLLGWRACLVLLVLTMPFFVPWSRDNADVVMNWVDWSFAEQRLTEFLWVASSFFAGGILYFAWAQRSALPRWPLALCPLILLIALIEHRPYDYFPLYAAYPLLSWATAPGLQLPSLKKIGDLSYGIYLYGWPYEQTVRGLIGPDARWWQIFVIAGLASALTAYGSWHLIERPALSLKRFLRRGSRPRSVEAAPR